MGWLFAFVSVFAQTTAAQIITEVTGALADFLPDYQVYILAFVAISAGVWLLRKVLKAAK